MSYIFYFVIFLLVVLNQYITHKMLFQYKIITLMLSSIPKMFYLPDHLQQILIIQ